MTETQKMRLLASKHNARANGEADIEQSQLERLRESSRLMRRRQEIADEVCRFACEAIEASGRKAIASGKGHVTALCVTDTDPERAIREEAFVEMMRALGWDWSTASGLANDGLNGSTEYYIHLSDVS